MIGLAWLFAAAMVAVGSLAGGAIGHTYGVVGLPLCLPVGLACGTLGGTAITAALRRVAR